MNIQIFGSKKRQRHKKSTAFFKERGILYVTEYSDWKARIQKNYEQQKENEDFCHFLVQKKRDIENLKKQVEIISIPLGCWRDQTEFLEDIMQVLGDKEQN